METVALSQLGLAGLMLAQFYIYYRFAKKIGGFLQKFRLDPPGPQIASLVVGQQAPVFTANDHLGRAYDASVLHGNTVMRLFTLPTCPICRTIVPRLSELQEMYPEIKMLVVTSDEGGEETEGISDQVPLILSTSIRRKHGITSVPTLVLINEENRVIAKDRVNNFEDLAKRLEVYLPQARRAV